MTSDQSNDTRELAFAAGMDDVLYRPVPVERAIKALNVRNASMNNILY